MTLGSKCFPGLYMSRSRTETAYLLTIPPPLFVASRFSWGAAAGCGCEDI